MRVPWLSLPISNLTKVILMEFPQVRSPETGLAALVRVGLTGRNYKLETALLHIVEDETLFAF